MTHSELPFVQGELKHLFKERNRARKLWQFTRHPQQKTELNRLQNTIKRKVGLYRQQVWEEHLTSLDAEDDSLWGTARAFRKKASPISALNGPTDDTAILSRHENLNTLVENINVHLAHLETWFSVWKIALNTSKIEAVFFSQRVPPEIKDPLVSPHQISWCLP
ncbi:uncharacterized protein TNCV_4443031 [Trichonephila clavipes]|nr:uncharacterized protein TNCV_4443031 [Trichonephila clavipes]